MEVQVRFRAVAGVTDKAEHLTSTNLISHLYLETPRLEVRVEGETSAAEIQNHVVSSDGFKRDGDRARRDSGDVLRNSVLRCDYGGIQNCESFASIRVVRLVVF